MRGSSWVPGLAGLVAVSMVVGCSHPPAPAPAAVFDLDEATIASLQQRMESGQDTARSLAEKYLARIEAIDRSGPDAQQRHRDQSGRAGDRRRARRRAQDQGPARPAARHPGADQGQHRHGGSHADDGGIARARGIDRAGGRLSRREAARGGRGDPRQDQSQRVGQLSIDALVERLERTRRADAQSVRARSQSVGLELGIGRRGRREPRRDRDRHRNRRIGRVAVEQQRARRHQADARPRQPLRHRPDLAQPGHGGPDDAHRGRCRRAALRDERHGFGGLRDPRQRREATARLHEVSRCRRALGRAPRRDAAAADGLQPGHRSRDGRRDRRSQAPRRDHRRSGGHADDRPVRRLRARGAALRVQSGSEQVPRMARSRRAASTR